MIDPIGQKKKKRKWNRNDEIGIDECRLSSMDKSMMMNVGIIQKNTTVASNHSESSPYISSFLSFWHNQARGEHRFVVVVTQTRALFD